jgi:hypothetical protein
MPDEFPKNCVYICLGVDKKHYKCTASDTLSVNKIKELCSNLHGCVITKVLHELRPTKRRAGEQMGQMFLKDGSRCGPRAFKGSIP